MGTPTFIHVVAIVYGLVLMAAVFLRAPLTEAMRIDALFLPNADERTRALNLPLGLLIAGYAAWSLIKT
jgi:hypothetical protein